MGYYCSGDRVGFFFIGYASALATILVVVILRKVLAGTKTGNTVDNYVRGGQAIARGCWNGGRAAAQEWSLTVKQDTMEAGRITPTQSGLSLRLDGEEEPLMHRGKADN